MSASKWDGSRSIDVPSRTWLTPMVGMGLWLSSVAVATVLVSGVVCWVRIANGPLAVKPNQGLWGSPEQKSATLRRVFDGRPLVVVHPRKGEIEAFLRDLAKPDEEKSPKWKAALDGERFRQRVVKSNYVKSLNRDERREIARQPITEFWKEGPDQFEQLDLVRISPWAEVGTHGTLKPLDDELVVFAYGRRGYGAAEPLVFWVHGQVGELKLSDWEFVGSGIAESEHAGFYESASRDDAAEELFRFYRYVETIDGLTYSDGAKFDQTMKLAEGCRVPQAWEDLARYILISRWSSRSRDDEVCRLAEQVKNPERIPGILAIHAVSSSRLDKEDQALALIARSENVIGFRPNLAVTRANLFSNKRREEALSEWQRLVEFDSSDVSYLSQWFRLLPNARRFEVIERIKSRPDSAKLSLTFAENNSYRLTPQMFQDLSAHITAVSPDSNEACEIEVLRLRNLGEFAAAAQLNRQAAEREADPQMKQSRWANFLNDMHSAGQVVAGFDAHPDPKAAFEILVSGIEDGEGMIVIDELPPILAAYRKQRPDDPRLAFYEGFFAADQQDYQKADERFLEAERLASKEKPPTKNDFFGNGDEPEVDESDAKDLLPRICRERCKARYELGDDVELFADYRKREEAYHALAEKALEYRHWKVLDRINRAFRQEDPSNDWLAYYSVRLAIANQEYGIARDQIRDMANREVDKPFLKYLRQQLQRELVSAENPDPLRKFELSEDRESAFNQIAYALLHEQDWENLEKLYLRHPDGPGSDEIALKRLDQYWQQDSAKVVELLTPWPDKLFSRQQYLASTWRERLVRSLLRLERRDEAMAISLDASQRFGEVWPMFMACVANRDSVKIEQLMSADDSMMDQWQYRIRSDDLELRPLLFDDSFADFRNRHPFDLAVDADRSSLMLLHTKPCEISEDWLSNRLAEPMNPESLLKISRISATRFVVHWNQTRFLLTSVPEPYFATDVLADPAIAKHLPDLSPEMRRAFAKQQAHWQIVSLGVVNGERWTSTEHQLRQFVARLLNDDVVGVAYRPWDSAVTTVLPLDASQSGTLAGRQPFVDLDKNAVILNVRWPRPLKLDDEKRQVLRAMGNKTPTEPTKRMIATVQLAGGDHPWLEKFQLLETRRDRFGGLEIIAEYCGQDHAITLPELRPGVRYNVPLENVVDVSQE